MRVRKEPAEDARVEPPAADGDEQRVAGASYERGPPVTEPPRDAPGRLLAERDEPLLPSLPSHVDVFAVEVDIGEVEPDGLGRAETAGVDELHERGVPQRERIVPVEGVDEPLYLCDLGRLGEATGVPGRERRLWDPCMPEGVPGERSNRGEPPRDRGRGEAAPRPSELGGVRREHPHVQVLQVEPPLGQPGREVPQIGTVGPPRCVGERRAREKPVDRHRGIHV